MNRRPVIAARLLPALLLVVLLPVLAACGGSAPAPVKPAGGEPAVEIVGNGTATGNADAGAPAAAAPPAMPTPEPLAGHLVIWHSWAGADADALAKILAAFKAQNPQVTVDTLYVAYPDLAQSYAEAVKSGSGPDVILAPSWWLGDLAKADALLPLDDRIAQDELAAYWPAAVDSLRWGGKLYGLPTNYELVSLFVNKVLADPAQLPKTTADWLAQAQQKPSLGIGLYNNLYHLYWGIPAYGGQLFDSSGNVVLDRTGNPGGYLTWLQDLKKTPGSYVDADYGMLLDRFKKGEFAYFVDGPWSIGELRAALGDNLAVHPLPAGPAGPAQPWLNADGVFVNPKLAADQQKLALALARAITSSASGTILATVARRLPAQRQADTSSDPLIQGFAQQAASAQPMPGLAEMAQAWTYGGDMFVKVVDGNADITQTITETAALINDANRK